MADRRKWRTDMDQKRKDFDEDGFDSIKMGWGGTFERLGEYLTKAGEARANT
jgi:hypothetical protein